jgi:hypothetical protein
MPMKRRRLVAAAFFSVVMAAVLALIVYTENINAAASVNVWILTRDVVAGAPYSPADVQQVQVRAQAGDFNYQTQGPTEVAARYVRALSAHDILRSDDLLAQSAQAEIALTVQNAPPLSPGDHIDIYATLGSNQQALIGHDVTVETVSGGSLTILTTAADESSWIAVGSSSVALHVARAVPGSHISASPLSADDAIRILCGPACAPTNPVGATPAPP